MNMITNMSHRKALKKKEKKKNTYNQNPKRSHKMKCAEKEKSSV